MAENSKIIWSEGLLLHPQHFQQHDRYIESLINGRCLGLRAYDWGFYTLTIDRALLKIGKLALAECQGIFRDGTPFSLPEDDDVPLPLDIPEDSHNERVFLALSARRAGAVETDSDAYPDSLARFRTTEREVKDLTCRTEIKAPLHVGKLKTRLMLEREERSSYTCLGVARIIEARADKSVILDEAYIPTSLNCSAMPTLGGFLRELHGLLNIRGGEIARRLASPGYGGVAEISDFLLLQLINRSQPLFSHLADVVGLHPEDFYRFAIQLAGELVTFLRPEKRPTAFPRYDHEDLQSTFSEVMEELRQLLSRTIDPRAISIELVGPKHGIYGARIPNVHLLDSAIFVLAAKAEIPPKDLETQFPPQVKIGPGEEIQSLIRTLMPGIAIQPIAPPRQIPVHAGFTYFELDKRSELWKKMATAAGLAIFVGARFPGLQLEFWAIKES